LIGPIFIDTHSSYWPFSLLFFNAFDATRREGSVILENILKRSTPFQLRRFLASMLTGSVAELCTNRFSSNVIEQILGQAITRFQDGTSGDEPEERPDPWNDEPPAGLEAVCVSLCEKVGQEWGDLVVHPQGSHCLRTVIRFTDGHPPEVQPVLR